MNPVLAKSKRLSKQTGWVAPEKTETAKLNEDEDQIREKLKNYVEVDNIDYVGMNTHVRYFVFDKRVNKYVFRTGGLLAKKDMAYVVLANGQLSWSVPKVTEVEGVRYPTKFWRVLAPQERAQKREQELAAELQQERDKQTVVSGDTLSQLRVMQETIFKLTKDDPKYAAQYSQFYPEDKRQRVAEARPSTSTGGTTSRNSGRRFENVRVPEQDTGSLVIRRQQRQYKEI
jgi:hypothetical protein